MAKDSATHDKGVLDGSEKSSTDVEPEVDTSSLDFMEQISDKNDEADAQEERTLAKAEGRDPAEWAHEDPVTLDELDKTAAVEKPTDTTVETKPDDETVEVKPDETTPTKELVTLVVDGKKIEVPLSDVHDAGIRTLQKESSADSRLEEATLLLKDAQKIVQTPVEVETPTQESDEDRKARLATLRSTYVHATQYGSEEEAVDALEKWEEGLSVTTAQPATAVTEEQIKNIINKTALESRVNSSPEEGGFSDLMNNPVLRAQTGALVDTLVQSGRGSYDSFETYKTAGESVRLIGATLDPEYKPPAVIASSTDTFKDKRDKKKTIDVIPTASQKATITSGDDDDVEKSPSEIIAEMKEKRGQ